MKPLILRFALGVVTVGCLLTSPFPVKSANAIRPSTIKTWVDKTGRLRSYTELEQLIAAHGEWLEALSKGEAQASDRRRLDLSRSSLRGISFARADLRYARFEEAELDGASFEQAKLVGSLLDQVNLEDANLERATLSRASLVGAHLNRANLDRASLEGTNLERANLQGASLRHVLAPRARFNEADLTSKVSLVGAILIDAHLRSAELNEASLDRAILTGAHLEDAMLLGASLKGSSLNGAYLDRVNLRGATLNSASLKWASLKGANLRYVIAIEAVMSNADLSGAFLDHAVFSKGRSIDATIFTGSKLTGAIGRNADFSHVDFTNANLEDSNLSDSNLSHAKLEGASLRTAILYRATLINADLTNANLEDAEFVHADLHEALYEPLLNPPVHTIYLAQGLSSLTWVVNPRRLAELKASFNEAGLGHSEKEILAAMKRHDSKWWEIPLFDWTYEYGANGLRPLLLLLFLWLAFSPLYFWALHLRGRKGLYLIATDRNGQGVREKKLRHSWPVFRTRRRFRSINTALFFSLRSTLNVGFGDLSFDRWVRMLHRRDFDVSARGWPRVVAGFQSLISLFLIALALVSYFGALT